MGLNLGQSLVGHSHSLCSIFVPEHLVGKSHFVLKVFGVGFYPYPSTTRAVAVPEPVACLPVDPMPLNGQPCLASVEEDVPNLTETWCARVGRTPGGPQPTREGGEGLWEGVTRQ